MELDLSAIVEAAAYNHTALEISASWQRLDLKDLHVRQAIEAGATLAVNTDAHSIEQLDEMRLGVATARRGWAPERAVLNSLPLADLQRWIARGRS